MNTIFATYPTTVDSKPIIQQISKIRKRPPLGYVKTEQLNRAFELPLAETSQFILLEDLNSGVYKKVKIFKNFFDQPCGLKRYHILKDYYWFVFEFYCQISIESYERKTQFFLKKSISEV